MRQVSPGGFFVFKQKKEGAAILRSRPQVPREEPGLSLESWFRRPGRGTSHDVSPEAKG